MIATTRNGMGARLGSRTLALGLAASMIAPGLMAGCGGNQASAPPLDATQGQAPMRPAMQQPKQGMSTKQKVVLLAGAALLYYMYKKRRDANNQPLPAGATYYQSKNGRIYYRDPKTHQAVYVTPPTQLSVPQSELGDVQGIDQYQGYNGAGGKRGMAGIFPTG